MIYGNQGHDEISVLPHFEGYTEGDVIPRLDAYGGWGNDIIHGSAEQQIDRLRGGPGDDVILGDVGADILRGGRGNDKLEGGPGLDLLIGDPLTVGYLPERTGDDVLVGGPDTDLLVGMGGTNSNDGGPGQDYCLDPSAAPEAISCEVAGNLDDIWWKESILLQTSPFVR